MASTAESLPALQEAAARTAALLRTVRDASATVPGLTWSVAETGAHIVCDLRSNAEFIAGQRDAKAYLDLAAGARNPAEYTAAANQRMLGEVTERDTNRLADMVVEAADQFASAAKEHGDGGPVLTVTSQPMTVPVLSAVLLGEQLVHGFDIARATGARWQISRREALIVIDGVLALVDGYVDPQRAAGKHVAYELRFRGGPRYLLTVDDGTAVVTAGGGKADCWISADPVAFLLVGYRRAGQWGQILRGKIISGGRKPWVALTFAGLLTSI